MSATRPALAKLIASAALQGAVFLLGTGCFRTLERLDVAVTCTGTKDCRQSEVCADGLCVPSTSPCIVVVDNQGTAAPNGGPCGDDGSGICVNAVCVKPTCGDLVATPPLETCDGEEGCRSDCTRCGDGVVDAAQGETCDDGAANSDIEPGACRSSCTVATCGDGVRDPGEGCDRGAQNSSTEPDACRPDCGPARCGDGTVDIGEECDDGAKNSDTTAGACRSTCALPACGDGVIDAGEACDDGRGNSDVQPGTCRTNCLPARCGDGTLDDGEQCDAGADNSDEAVGACRRSCVRAACGDGVVDPAEACDDADGNSDSRADACREDCRAARCGDGTIDTGELCDDGAANSDVRPGACRTSCVPAVCGDGIRDTGEECDSGALNSNTRADACRTTCRRSRCGDGIVDSQEQCDHGISNSDSLAGACRTSCLVASCGDGVIDDGEGCDDGLNNSDVRPGACRTTCVPASCGDGVRDPGESCDRGALNSDTDANACRTTCAPNTCGDGTLDTFEQCDEGAGNSDELANACRSTCVLPRCGDGVVDDGELCDDGAANSDVRPGACRTTCVPSDCGDGALDTGEECDSGAENSDTAPDACRTDCRRARCGDGVIDEGEVCDDANLPGGACRSDCGKVEVCGDGVLDQGESCDDANGNPHDGCDNCARMTWEVRVRIGPGVAPRPADGLSMSGPSGLAFGVDDALYVAEYLGNRVRRIVNNDVTDIAGTGTTVASGDGGPASVAGVPYPYRVAIDGTGRIAVVDFDNNQVRMIGRDGLIQRVAGTGASASFGDGNGAFIAGVVSPVDVAYDGLGNLFIAEGGANRVRRVDNAGIITTVFGTGTNANTGDGLLGRQAAVAPFGLAMDRLRGRLYVADRRHHVVRMLDENGIARTVAGVGTAGYTGDNGPARQARLNNPMGIAVARDGTLYVSDNGNDVVRRIDTSGIITTLAGTGLRGFSGDGGPARAATLNGPSGVAVDSLGQVFVADDYNNRIRRIDLDGKIQTVAGQGIFGDVNAGIDALSATLYDPYDSEFDPRGRLLLADTVNSRVIRVEEDGTIKVLAGTGPGTYTNNGGSAVDVTFGAVSGIAVDALERIYVADPLSHRVLRFEEDGGVETVAGTGVAGFGGDGGLATQAQLNTPFNVAIDPAGRVIIVDQGNARIRRIDAQGVITTVAGNGTTGFSGDNGLATLASLNAPFDAQGEADGSVLTADSWNRRVRMVDAAGTIRTIAGTGAHAFTSDGSVAETATLAFPTSARMDANGRVLIAEFSTGRIRRIDLDGKLRTVAGAGGPRSFRGDGGLATAARLGSPQGLTLRPDGAMAWVDYLHDLDSSRVRFVDPDGRITTIAGLVHPAMVGFGASGRVIGAQHAAMLADGRLVVAAGGSARIAIVDLETNGVDAVLGYDPIYQPAGGADARFFLFGEPSGITVTPSGVAYVADAAGARILALDVTNGDTERWTVQSLSVTGLREPRALAWDDTHGELLVADAGDHCIRRVAPATGAVTVALGRCGHFGASPDGAATADARLNRPEHLLLEPDGTLYVSDTANHRVIMVRDGTVSTVLGTGAPSSSGIGTAGRQPVDSPRGLATDAHGNLYVAGRQAVRVVADIDGDGLATGDDLALTAAALDAVVGTEACLTSLVARGDDLIVFDACSGSVRALQPSRVP